MSEPDETILQEADRLVDTDRNTDYGHPFQDFERVAYLWRGYHLAAGHGIVSIEPEDVAMLMLLVKVARELHKPKRDSRVDMAGYAKCLDLVVAERERRSGTREHPDGSGFGA